MVILVLNCGSSSIKYQVIDMEAQSSKLLAKGLVERIGLPEGDLTHKPVGKEKFELHQPIPDHTTGISLVLQASSLQAQGGLLAVQSSDTCYDSVAADAVIGGGGLSASPVDLAAHLAERWTS